MPVVKSSRLNELMEKELQFDRLGYMVEKDNNNWCLLPKR